MTEPLLTRLRYHRSWTSWCVCCIHSPQTGSCERSQNKYHDIRREEWSRGQDVTGSGLAPQGLPTISLEDVAGGNLLHNKILRQRDGTVFKSGLGKKWQSFGQPSTVGFFDGQKILSVATRPVAESSWNEWLGRIFTYGISVLRARKLPTGTMNDFRFY